MFRFEEDAFLRKGGEQSRNCLPFEEEEEEREKLTSDPEVKRFSEDVPALLEAKAGSVFVSAGGYATETLVKAMVEGTEYKSPSVQFGKYCWFMIDLTKDGNALQAFVCPSARRSPSEPAYLICNQERLISQWIVSNCDASSHLLVFSTLSAREQGDDFSLRKLDNGLGKEDSTLKKVKWLEEGRLVTSYAAAIMEIATLNGIPCTLIVAPREPVLSRETLDLLLGASLKLDACKNRLGPQAADDVLKAIKLDERDQRRFEPEGMFM